MRKFCSKLHLWLSLPFAIIIAIVCATGALLVFQTEIQEHANPQLYFVEEVGEHPLPMAELTAKVQSQLPDSVVVTGYRIMQDPARTYQLRVKGSRNTYMVNPYTGEITGTKERSKFFSKVVGLHGHLLDAHKNDGIFWGKMIVGVSTLVFVFILISGLVIWFPRSKKALKNRLQIHTDKGWFCFFMNLHVSGGFYASLFLLAMALTGLTWSFDWYHDAFFKVFGKETVEQRAPHKSALPKPKELNMDQWDNVLAQIREKYDDFNSIVIQKNTVNVAYGNINKRDSYEFNVETGEIVDARLYEDQPYNSRLGNWIFAIHSGKWGGMTTRILHCLAAILGAVFCITGYYFWLKKKLRKKGKAHKTCKK